MTIMAAKVNGYIKTPKVSGPQKRAKTTKSSAELIKRRIVDVSMDKVFLIMVQLFLFIPADIATVLFKMCLKAFLLNLRGLFLIRWGLKP